MLPRRCAPGVGVFAGKGQSAPLGARHGDGRSGGLAGPGAGDDAKGGVDGVGGSVATSAEGLTAEVVVVDDWKQLSALPPGVVKGKILLFNHKFDKELAAQGGGLNAYGGGVVYRGAGPIAGAAAGAAAVLVRSVGGADYRLPHTGLTEYAEGVPRIPAAAVTAEDADLLKDLASQGAVKLHLTLTPQTLPDAESYNVIADWKGSEHPEQWAGGCGRWPECWTLSAPRPWWTPRKPAWILAGLRKRAFPALRRCRTTASASTITTRRRIRLTRWIRGTWMKMPR